MVQGTVKWFSPEKGYGFITPDQGGKDVFVHASALETSPGMEGQTSLAENQRIEFEVSQGDKGPQATDVHVL